MATTTNFGWTTPNDTDLVKDGAAAIRTLGSSIDTTLVDLKGGTTGQVLAKATGTDMDFAWVAQDDSNAIQNAIIDAKGDLIVGTAADTPGRLAVGTNGQALLADSTTATGLIWGSSSPSYTWTTWTPVMRQGGTTVTTSGNNSKFVTVGNICIARVAVTLSSTGASNASMRFSLPVNAATGFGGYNGGFPAGNCTFFDSSATAIWHGFVGIRGASDAYLVSGYNKSLASTSTNEWGNTGSDCAVTLGSGDTITAILTYEWTV